MIFFLSSVTSSSLSAVVTTPENGIVYSVDDFYLFCVCHFVECAMLFYALHTQAHHITYRKSSKYANGKYKFTCIAESDWDRDKTHRTQYGLKCMCLCLFSIVFRVVFKYG